MLCQREVKEIIHEVLQWPTEHVEIFDKCLEQLVFSPVTLLEFFHLACVKNYLKICASIAQALRQYTQFDTIKTHIFKIIRDVENVECLYTLGMNKVQARVDFLAYLCNNKPLSETLLRKFKDSGVTKKFILKECFWCFTLLASYGNVEDVQKFKEVFGVTQRDILRKHKDDKVFVNKNVRLVFIEVFKLAFPMKSYSAAWV